MKRQSNIELNRFTNFLNQGAFLRKRGVWTFLAEPQNVFVEGGVSTLKADFLSVEISKKNYKFQWDMTTEELVRALDLLDRVESEKQEKFIIEWNPVDKDLFVKAFQMAQAALDQEFVKKVVPIARQLGKASQPISPVQKLRWLRQLARLPQHLYPYGEWTLESGFMGATPEILFEKRGQELETMALAGTAPKERAPSEFLEDPKERKEHQYVIDDIVEILSAIASVQVGPTRVIELPTLNHLETPIVARLLNEVSVDDIVRRLHPTPALGIYPRNSYFQEFRRYPHQQQRGIFGAPWGMYTSENSMVLVAIRKWDWCGQEIQIFAGCGVVQESVMEKEFAEILKKIDSVKRIFCQD